MCVHIICCAHLVHQSRKNWFSISFVVPQITQYLTFQNNLMYFLYCIALLTLLRFGKHHVLSFEKCVHIDLFKVGTYYTFSIKGYFSCDRTINLFDFFFVFIFSLESSSQLAILGSCSWLCFDLNEFWFEVIFILTFLHLEEAVGEFLLMITILPHLS